MLIRKAKLKDLPQVVTLAVNLLDYHCRLDPYFTPVKNVRAIYQKSFKRYIYSKNKRLLVAEEDNKIVGYALGKISPRPPVFKIKKIGLISEVFVEKRFRQTGITKKFLATLDKWFTSKKIKYVELTVHVKNEVGKKTWTKCGFKDYLVRKRIDRK